MLKSFISVSFVAVLLLMTACSSAPKKEVEILVDVSSTNNSSNKASAVPVLTEQEKQSYIEGVAALQAGEYETAEEVFKSLLSKHSNLAGALVNLGLIEKSRKNTEKAFDFFKKALSANPKNVAALVELGGYSQKAGRFLEAEAYYLKAYERDQNHSVVNYNLGVLYELYIQDYSKAIDHYEQYVELGEGDDIETVKRWIKLLERK